MTPTWKWYITSVVVFLIHFDHVHSQTTLLSTTSIATTELPEVTTPTTTFVPTLTPLITTEGSTLATAESEMPTTASGTEQATVESTTEEQSTNEALRASGLKRGYRFESTRNKPSANQEVSPESETEIPTTVKPEEKKIAWKFGRGGNNLGPWSSRPSPNSGYPIWKKQPTGGQDEQNVNPGNSKPNDQAYYVWNVGQGNQQNGWDVDGNADSWAPAGAISDTGEWTAPEAGNNADSNGWNAGTWSQDQSPDVDVAQGGWTNDDAAAQGDGTAQGWDNNQAAAWNTQDQNSGVWVNPQIQEQPADGQSPNSWQPDANGGGDGAWVAASPQQENNGGAGWAVAQQDGGWDSQPPPVDNQGNQNGGWNNNGGGWNGPPAQTSPNTWNNGGWNNGQQNSAWSNGATGSPGWQDAGVSWKVYNEDTQKMENIDENSSWKVIGDGGPDGWKLIDENGNVEWKIENINGEWKVTSADDLTNINETASVSSDTLNVTSDVTNVTTDEPPTTTTPPPSGGWDDDKQGRYIIWKFSDDGKGEARVYGGDGREPEVWTVGDNNQWWKETMGVKEADTVVQGGINSGVKIWKGNGGRVNAAPQTGNAWVNRGTNTLGQNGGWQRGRGSQNRGSGLQQPIAPSNGAGTWQNNGAPQQGGRNGWQTRGPQNVNVRWRNKGGATTQQKWNNGGTVPQNANAWQNQAQSANWNTGNSAAPVRTVWQNSGTASQSSGTPWQNNQQQGWQNNAPQAGGRWVNGGQNGGVKNKGRGRSNGIRPPGRWVQNNSRQNRLPKGRVWNSGNGWQTTPNVQAPGKAAWSRNAVATNGGSAVLPNVASRASPNAGASQGRAWADTGGGGQTTPYIIVIKSPDTGATTGVSPNTWVNPYNRNGGSNRSKNNNFGPKPRNNQRNTGYKMNRAGSSGWQWNPQGGRDGWQWRDGWMGSGGGFGGWTRDNGTMYSSWRPTKVDGAQSRKSSIQRSGGDGGSRKSASKMVFVFGTKRSSGNNAQPAYKAGKKGKKVIIIDYSKKAPNGEAGMKKDIESVIQALKTAKPTSGRGASVLKQPGQKTKSQQ